MVRLIMIRVNYITLSIWIGKFELIGLIIWIDMRVNSLENSSIPVPISIYINLDYNRLRCKLNNNFSRCNHIYTSLIIMLMMVIQSLVAYETH